MKILMYTTLSLLAATLFCSSCKQTITLEEETPETDTVPKPLKEVQSIWMSYKTMADFSRNIKQLQEYNPEELATWEKKQEGFISWRTLAESTMDSTVADIPDAAFARLLSKDGRLQIADTIYQFVPGQQQGTAYAIPEVYKPVLIRGVKDFMALKGTKAYNITLTWLPFPRWGDEDRIVIPDPAYNICDFPNSFLFPWWGQKGGQIFHADNGAELIRDNGRRVRIDYHRWRVGYLFYSSAGVRVKAWKDTRLAGWLSNINMDRVSIESCIRGKIVIPGLFPANFQESVSLSTTNDNKLEKTLQWATAPMHVEILPDHFNLKFSVTYRGQSINRFIRE